MQYLMHAMHDRGGKPMIQLSPVKRLDVRRAQRRQPDAAQNGLNVKPYQRFATHERAGPHVAPNAVGKPRIQVGPDGRLGRVEREPVLAFGYRLRQLRRRFGPRLAVNRLSLGPRGRLYHVLARLTPVFSAVDRPFAVPAFAQSLPPCPGAGRSKRRRQPVATGQKTHY